MPFADSSPFPPLLRFPAVGWVLGAIAMVISAASPVQSQTITDAAATEPIVSSPATPPAHVNSDLAPDLAPDLPNASDVFLFQDLILSAAFTPDPQYLRGIAGGMEAAATQAGIDRTPTGPCVGQINTLPNHRIYLQDFFESLRLRVISEGDTTIVIRGPGGTWCNDDYDGRNAGIAGQWLAGTYEIWVGSYDSGTFSPYELEFSEVILPRSTRDRPAIFRR